MMGGMGVVYFALDHSNDGRPVALKTFRPEILPNRAARDRFLREGTAWVNLGSHPHIVRCHKVEYIDPTAFLVLELIAKEQGMEEASLRSWMWSPMKVERALLFALQVARGLQHASTKIPGFVHRDLKPENVLVGADKLTGTNVNRLRVTDFGLATMSKGESRGLIDEEDRAVGRTHLTRGILGTPLYMAPEQWRGEEVGVYTDVYALGCILYDMLTAKHVGNGKSVTDLRTEHCEGKLRPTPECMPHDVKVLMGRCLSLRPAERYQGWDDITHILEKAYVGLVGYLPPAEMSSAQASRGERMQEGWSHNSIGLAYKDMGRAEVAKGYFEKSVSIAREIGDRNGEGTGLGNLGIVYKDLGDVQRAIGYYEQHLEITRETKDRRGEGNALGNLGNARYLLRDLQRAIEYYEQYLDITQEIRDRRGEGNVMGNLGNVCADLGDMQRAIGYYEQHLEITRDIGDRRGEASALGNLGLVYTEVGDMGSAIEHYEQALAIDREIGDRRGEGADLGNLGIAYASLGNMQLAIEYFEQDLVIAHEMGDRRGEISALQNLGKVFNDSGDTFRAIGYYEQAINIQRKIGYNEGVAINSLKMAMIYANERETSRALVLAQEAARIFALIGSPDVQMAQHLIAQLRGR